ncbi:hypothetical protein K488DRAFT_10582, partial [Vararia minispora EC-137]
RSVSRARSKSSAPSVQIDKKNYTVGIGLLFVVVCLWTASNFITQDLFDTGYNKPFFVTYASTSSFAVYLIPFGVRRLWQRRKGLSSEGARWALRHSPGTIYGSLSARARPPHDRHGLHEVQLPPLTTWDTLKLAMLFTGPWFFANWTLDAGLLYTSVASATILSGTSGFFTLCVGRLAGVDTLTLAKVGAVATSFIGVALVSLSDSESPSSLVSSHSANKALLDPPTRQYLVGDILALLSAFLYALYAITLKVRIRSESRVDMQLFFGFVGAFNIVASWPMGLLLHFTGVETFELPSTHRAVAGLLVNMAITVSSDFIYAIAMLKTSPLVVTVGLSLTMPLAVIGDVVLGHPVKAQVVVGAALVLAAFAIIGVEDSHRSRD